MGQQGGEVMVVGQQDGEGVTAVMCLESDADVQVHTHAHTRTHTHTHTHTHTQTHAYTLIL